MATLAPSPRTTTITLAEASAGPFYIGFRLFDEDGLEVYVDGQPRNDFTIGARFLQGFDDDATIAFPTELAAGARIIVDGALTPRREADYQPADPGLTRKLNIELPRLWSAIAEVRRNAGRAIRSFTEGAPFDPEDGAMIVIRGGQPASGPTEQAVSNAVIQAGDAIAIANGVKDGIAPLAGGLQSQFLQKLSDTPFDTGWADLSVGAGVVSGRMFASYAGDGTLTPLELPLRPKIASRVAVFVGGVEQPPTEYSVNARLITPTEPWPLPLYVGEQNIRVEYDQPIAPEDAPDYARRSEEAMERAEAAAARLLLDERLTFAIGPTGDFPTINEFISFAASYRPLPDPDYAPTGAAVWRRQPMLTAVIQAGFTMAEQVFLDGGDYSHIEIWGPEGVNGAPILTSVPVQRSAITKRAPGSGEFYPVFFGRNCIFPRIRARLAVDASSAATLVRGAHLTNCLSLFTGGITDCPERGVVVYAGDADLSGSLWDRAGTIGIRLANRASALLTGAKARGCGIAAGAGESGERAGMNARGAKVVAIGLELTGTQGEGAIMVGVDAHLEQFDVSGATTNGLRTAGSVLNAPGMKAMGCGSTGIAADRGAVLTVQGADVSGSATGIAADNASKVDAQQANANNCGTAVTVRNGSEVSFRTGTGTNCTGIAAIVASASTLQASNADFTGYGGVSAVTAHALSRVNLDTAKVTKADLTPRATDVDFYTGSQINMTGATGSWVGAPTVNAINGSRGIVWKQ